MTLTLDMLAVIIILFGGFWLDEKKTAWKHRREREKRLAAMK